MMTLTFAAVGSVLLYLFPIALVLWMRSRADRRLAAIALDISMAVAADLMLVLAFALVMRLAFAAIASRMVWTGVGMTYAILRRRSLPNWPRALGRRECFAGIVSVVMGVMLSMVISRRYSIWDREWHTPLVSSLRGQQLPFHNVHNSAEVLHYHFSGDVHAAMLQTFSGGILHSSFALTLSHDVIFGLIGLTVALLLYEWVTRSLPMILGLELFLFLSGPYTLGRDAGEASAHGYNFLNSWTMSFRPHDVFAELFFVSFVGALLGQTGYRRRGQSTEGPLALVFATCGLAISDEASIGILGLCLGLVWVVYPDVLHPKRWVGVAVFALLLIALFGPNLVFSASLSPGAQKHTIGIVPWRSPGYYVQTLSLASMEGRRMLMYDVWPTFATLMGGTLGWIAWRGRRKLGLALLHAILFVVSVVALTRIDVNKTALESHRFMTALVFVSPLLALVQMDQFKAPRGNTPNHPIGAGWLLLRGFAFLTFLVGATAGALSTADWFVRRIPTELTLYTLHFSNENLYSLHCRRDMGHSFGERPRYTYMSKSIWFAYAGCQPVFAVVHRTNTYWSLTIGNPVYELGELEKLNRRLLASESLPIICSKKRTRVDMRDVVCDYAQAHSTCRDRSWRLVECEMSGPERAVALEKLKQLINHKP